MKLFIVIICVLSSFTAIKVGNIQIIELFEMLIIFFLLGWLFLHHRTRYKTLLGNIYKQYLLLIIALGFIALFVFSQQTFYIPNTSLSFIKHPPWLSVSRLVQLFLAATTMVFLAEILSRHNNLFFFFVKVYIFTGVINALYGTVSYVALLQFNIETGGAYYSGSAIRAKGFFVEGGPFGVYLTSVVLMTLFQYFILRGKKVTNTLLLIVLLVGIFLSYSKAGILVMLFLILLLILFSRKQNQGKVIVLSMMLLIIIGHFTLFEAIPGMKRYVESYQNIYELIPTHQDDANLVMGRIAASIIVPKIIEAHPIVGVGIGNYSVVRNDPNYLGILPSVDAWDLTGLGLLGYVAETGIPVFLLLILLLLKPYRLLKKNNSSGIYLTLASYQPVAHLFGVQLTFLYPWLITSFALACLFYNKNFRVSSQKGLM